MSLEDYREQLIECLKHCRDAKTARTLISEAHLVVTNSRLTLLTQGRFWETLQEDLDAIAESARFLEDREAGVKLAAVVAAAQARVARYRERTGLDSKAGDRESK